MSNQRSVIFVGCGQWADEEKSLGRQIVRLIEDRTNFHAYFAETQSNLQGITEHIFNSISGCVGFIAVMHHRGQVTTPTELLLEPQFG